MGVTLYEMVTKELPWKGSSFEHVRQLMRKEELLFPYDLIHDKQALPEELKSFISELLEMDAE